MNDNTSITIVLGICILTIGGCVYGTAHDKELNVREREKTKQMAIQSRIDSLLIVTNFENENGKKH